MVISVAEMLRRAKAYRNNYVNEAAGLLADKAKDLADLVRSQMYQGLTGAGGQIGRYKDPEYAADKYEMNPAAGFGNMDLRLTGSFYSKIEAQISGGILSMYSTDSKAEMLMKRHGKIILKLSSDSKNIIRVEILQPGLVHAFAEKVGGQIG